MTRPPTGTASAPAPALVGGDRLPEQAALKDRALDVAAEGITIADASRPDRPLIYANQGFARMTGYAVAEVMGRNCRFLQGPDTDPGAAQEIRQAIEAERECIVEILNYRKDGSTFWNRLSITPVRDESGRVSHFIGIQSDVTSRRLAEGALRAAKEALELDLRLAARVQQALLPPPEVTLGEFRIARAFHPCTDLAGDGVGIVSLPDGALALYLLDVSGHGVGAALLSFTLNHLFSATVGGVLTVPGTGGGVLLVEPSGVAERLNRQFPIDRTRQYFTLVYGVLDTATAELRYVMAGHPAPVYLPVTGPPRPVAGSGLPVGMLEGTRYEDERLQLEPGDRVYFYTDGVIEALNAREEDFGQARLLSEIDALRSRDLRDGLDCLADAVRGWCGGNLRDDVTLLGVERRRY
ncbi:MAG: rsbP 2 [Acidobacteria bacterium]|nr:rsbP 2 [Acidobacteriota bacterium]